MKDRLKNGVQRIGETKWKKKKKKKPETGGKIEGLILNRASGLPGDDDARERRRRN